MFWKLFCSFFLLCRCGFTANAQSARGLIIERCSPCDDTPNQKINLTMVPKTFSYPQVLDLTLITPVSLGNQLKYIGIVELENKIGFKSWQRLIKFEDDFCRALQVYAGSLAYDMETALGIVPRGACPIPRGNYHAVNYTIDFSLMKIQGLPLGKLRFTVKFVEKSTKDILLCIVTLISNKPRV